MRCGTIPPGETLEGGGGGGSRLRGLCAPREPFPGDHWPRHLCYRTPFGTESGELEVRKSISDIVNKM